MKKFLTVFKFEYTNYVRSKAFIVMTAILLLLVLIGGNYPAFKGAFDSIMGNNAELSENKPQQTADLKKAAYYAKDGGYDSELLSVYCGKYEWVEVSESEISLINDKIIDGDYEMAIAIDGLNYKLYQKGADMLTAVMYDFSGMIRSVYQDKQLAAEGLTQARIDEILGYPTGETIIVGTDAGQNFWMGYVMLFLLYFTIILYGQYVSTSVITEKTSKAMELLLTSSKPMPLMFGKVIGTGLAGLTQFGAFAISAFAVLKLNAASWNEISPMIGGIVNSSLSSGIFLYAVVFFLLGFFTFSFLFAAVSSTVSRQEDAQSVIMIPMLLFIAAFMIAMMGMANAGASYVTVCSFVPFLSPMVMFMRICMDAATPAEIFISIALNLVYLLGVGYVGAKIYRVGVMLYGTKPKIGDLIRYIRQA